MHARMNTSPFQNTSLITPQHAVDKITQRTPEIFPTSQVVLVNEENIVFETGVQVGLQTKLANNGVVVAVDVSIDTVHSLEYLPNHAWKGFRKRDTWLHQRNNISAAKSA